MSASDVIPSVAARTVNPIWRLGHRGSPCSFVPRELCAWRNRFDDPQRHYRTLYGAQEAMTCLRELLADLRPDPKALAEFDELFSEGSTPSLTVAGVVSAAWREAHVLVKASIEPTDARLAKLEDPATLRVLQHEHRSLLAGFGIAVLRPQGVRTRERIITQQFSRTLYGTDYAGIAFHSRMDGRPCYALFEGRASLKALRTLVPMTDDAPELVRVCGEYNLILKPVHGTAD